MWVESLYKDIFTHNTKTSSEDNICGFLLVEAFFAMDLLYVCIYFFWYEMVPGEVFLYSLADCMSGVFFTVEYGGMFDGIAFFFE